MARLTAAAREQLKRSDFGVPSLKKYPIDTVRRARAALARVVQHGNGPMIHQVRERVHRKHPGIAVAGLNPARRKRK